MSTNLQLMETWSTSGEQVKEDRGGKHHNGGEGFENTNGPNGEAQASNKEWGRRTRACSERARPCRRRGPQAGFSPFPSHDACLRLQGSRTGSASSSTHVRHGRARHDSVSAVSSRGIIWDSNVCSMICRIDFLDELAAVTTIAWCNLAPTRSSVPLGKVVASSRRLSRLMYK
jgi:hypothetical protein